MNNSTADGQRAMCGRASRVAVLQMLDAKLGNPVDQYDWLHDDHIDQVRDNLLAEYNTKLNTP